MSDTAAEPTAGARRCASAFADLWASHSKYINMEELVRLVERETGLPELIAERERLAAIVQRLPRTADGVPVVPGMTLYSEEGIAHEDFVWYTDLENWKNWYSTPAAALAAASIKPEGT